MIFASLTIQLTEGSVSGSDIYTIQYGVVYVSLYHTIDIAVYSFPTTVAMDVGKVYRIEGRLAKYAGNKHMLSMEALSWTEMADKQDAWKGSIYSDCFFTALRDDVVSVYSDTYCAREKESMLLNVDINLRQYGKFCKFLKPGGGLMLTGTVEDWNLVGDECVLLIGSGEMSYISSKSKHSATSGPPPKVASTIKWGAKIEPPKEQTKNQNMKRSNRVVSESDPDEDETKKTVSKKCGSCGKIGHNSRTCPKNQTSIPSPPVKRFVICDDSSDESSHDE